MIDDYPNLQAILNGTVSGKLQEWPAIRRELEALLEEMETLRGVNKIIAAGQTEDQPGPWVQRAFDALAHALSLLTLIKEADEYLDTNAMTNIAHGSILHQKFKDARGDLVKAAESI